MPSHCRSAGYGRVSSGVELNLYEFARNRQERHENRTLFVTMRKAHSKPFALCIDSGDYKASIIPDKVCKILPDRIAASDDFVRIDRESHSALVDFTPANAGFWMQVGRCA